MDNACYKLISGAGLEPILSPRFVGGRGQASGFVMRMMAENKLKHSGQYRNPSAPLHPQSTMRAPVPFDYKKLANSDQKGTNSSAYGASPFIINHFSGEPKRWVSRKERLERGDVHYEAPGETVEQREARLRTSAASLLEKAEELAGIQKGKQSAATKIQSAIRGKFARKLLAKKKGKKAEADAKAAAKAAAEEAAEAKRKADAPAAEIRKRNADRNYEEGRELANEYPKKLLYENMGEARGSPLTEAEKAKVAEILQFPLKGEIKKHGPWIWDATMASLRRIAPGYKTGHEDKGSPWRIMNDFLTPSNFNRWALTYSGHTTEDPVFSLTRSGRDKRGYLSGTEEIPLGRLERPAPVREPVMRPPPAPPAPTAAEVAFREANLKYLRENPPLPLSAIKRPVAPASSPKAPAAAAPKPSESAYPIPPNETRYKTAIAGRKYLIYKDTKPGGHTNVAIAEHFGDASREKVRTNILDYEAFRKRGY